jgi:hypothetical protein
MVRGMDAKQTPPTISPWVRRALDKRLPAKELGK